MENSNKKQITIVAISLTCLGLLGLGLNVWNSNQQAAADQASLKSQKAAISKSATSRQGQPNNLGMMPMGNPFEDLGLSAEQQTKIDALMKDMPQPTFEAGKMPNPEVMQEKFKEHQAKIDAILTPEQRQKLQTKRPDPALMQGNFPGGNR